MLPSGYDYTLEFRHPSWQTEGPWELLQQYNVAAAMTDSPDLGLNYLSNKVVTAEHAFIRMHGRQKNFWYNYLYSDKELKPWVERIKEIQTSESFCLLYFNNHPGGKAVYNALMFREMTGEMLNETEKSMLEKLDNYFAEKTLASRI